MLGVDRAFGNRTAMPEPAGLLDALSFLGALQLADSFFPSGRYTLSHGLESFVQLGWVCAADDLQSVLEDYVVGVIGTADAVATAEATRAASRGDMATVVAVDEQLRSTKLPHETALSSRRTGRGLVRLAVLLSEDRAVREYADLVEADRAPGNYATAVGVLAAAWGLCPIQAALVELYSFVAGFLGAALRTLRLDHVLAQQFLHELRPLLAQVAGEAAGTPYTEIRSFAPAVDVMQMRHERASVRLFAS
jgi:urease accessory protein